MANPAGVEAIGPGVEAEILKARVSESPTPSHRQLADRFHVSKSAVQRLLKKSESTMNRLDRKGVQAELVIDALPQAIAEVKALTRDLPITKMCKIMEEAETQFNKHKEEDPHLAGAYLDQMRKCAIEMAKWLGIDNGALAQREPTVQDTLAQMSDEEVERRAREVLARRQ